MDTPTPDPKPTPSPVRNYWNNAIPPHEIHVGQLVTIYGPNLIGMPISNFYEGDSAPTLPTGDPIIFKWEPSPSVLSMMGFPLRVKAVNFPYVLLTGLDVDQVPVGAVVIDCRTYSLNALTQDYADAFMKTAKELMAIEKAPKSKTRQPPSHPSHVIQPFRG